MQIIVIMALARSMSGTIGGHEPIISIHDTWYAEARGSRDNNWRGPNALSIRPTDETWTHNLRIMELVLLPTELASSGPMIFGRIWTMVNYIISQHQF